MKNFFLSFFGVILGFVVALAGISVSLGLLGVSSGSSNSSTSSPVRSSQPAKSAVSAASSAEPSPSPVVSDTMTSVPLSVETTNNPQSSGSVSPTATADSTSDFPVEFMMEWYVSLLEEQLKESELEYDIGYSGTTISIIFADESATVCAFESQAGDKDASAEWDEYVRLLSDKCSELYHDMRDFGISDGHMSVFLSNYYARDKFLLGCYDESCVDFTK